MLTVTIKQGQFNKIEKTEKGYAILYKDNLFHELTHLYKAIKYNPLFAGYQLEIRNGAKINEIRNIILKINAILDYFIFKKTKELGKYKNDLQAILSEKELEKLKQSSIENLNNLIESICNVQINKVVITVQGD